jgi:CO/xanthine dehydrogenase Mo-binding subunit
MADKNGKPSVGGDHRRIDARDKVSGQARYVGDIAVSGLCHAKVVRSPHHHARLTSLDAVKAVRLPGVIRVITAEDIPGINGFPEYSRHEPLLTPVGDTVKQKGAPVALVVATTRKAAQVGARAVKAKYIPLHHIFDLTEGVLTIYEGGNLLNEYHKTRGDVDASLSESDVIVESHYDTAFQEHAALEPDSVISYLDDDGRVTVLGGTHEPHWQRNWIADALGLSPEGVRFIAPPVGGSFGNRQDPWPLVATALMTFITRRPIRLVYSRSESFEASPKRHPYQMDYKIGATNKGQLTGIQVRIRANTGGYDSAGYHIPEYAVMAGGGPYHWQAADIHAQSIFSNAPKCGQFRGFGTPQSTFALECTLDEMIETLDEDPLEFRLKNRIQQSTVTFMGYPVAESLGFVEVLEALQPRYQAFQDEVNSFNARMRDDPAGNPLRKGIGVAGMWYRFGKSGKLRIEAHAELARDGHFIIYASAPEYGQGIGTVLVQLSSETLGVPRDIIELVNADTLLTPDSDVQGASRATYWVGNAVCEAVTNLKSVIMGTAAELMDCDPAGLIFEDKKIVNRHNPNQSIPLEKVAQEFDRLGKSRRMIGLFDQSPYFPEETRPTYTPHFVTGAHLAEVLVDVETGEVQVTRYVAAHDVGKVINQKGAEGQIEGAVFMGIGAALMEAFLPGQTTGLSDYILPMVGDLPEIETILVEVPGYHGPMGAKGLGEAPVLPSAPAIINAVSRAIGVRIRKIPATPERIVWASKSKIDQL